MQTMTSHTLGQMLVCLETIAGNADALLDAESITEADQTDLEALIARLSLLFTPVAAKADAPISPSLSIPDCQLIKRVFVLYAEHLDDEMDRGEIGSEDFPHIEAYMASLDTMLDQFILDLEKTDHFFALDAKGSFVDLGKCAGFEEAERNDVGRSAIWLFDLATAHTLYEQLGALIKAKPQT